MDAESVLLWLNVLLDELEIVIPGGLVHLSDLTPSFCIIILKRLLRTSIPIPNLDRARDRSTRIFAMKVFIGTLGADILKVDLSGIDPRKAADGDEQELLIIGRHVIQAAEELGYLKSDVTPLTPVERGPSPAPTSSTAPTTTPDSSRDSGLSSSAATTAPAMDIDEVLPPSSGAPVHPAAGLLDLTSVVRTASWEPGPALSPSSHLFRPQSSSRDYAHPEETPAESSNQGRLRTLYQLTSLMDPHPLDDRAASSSMPPGHSQSLTGQPPPDHFALEVSSHPPPPLGWGSGPVRPGSVTARSRRTETGSEGRPMKIDTPSSPIIPALDSPNDHGGPPEEGYIGVVDDVEEYEASFGSHLSSHSRSTSSASALHRNPDVEKMYDLMKRRAELLQRLAERKLSSISARGSTRQRLHSTDRDETC